MSFPVSKTSVKPRKPRAKRPLKAIKPQITSLVDIMTVLCMFMLQSFSTENQIVTETKDLILPESSAKKLPELTVTLKVNNTNILAEDVVVANVNDIASNDEMVIPGLYKWLGERRASTEKLSLYSSKTKFKGDVMIQADKRIRFKLLKRIMYTCGQQGYNNFSLAVRQKGKAANAN